MVAKLKLDEEVAVSYAVNIRGEKADPNTIQFFNGHESLFTAVQVMRLADKLGVKLVQDDKSNWTAFQYQGKHLSNVNFYHPSHAYAFLLGVAAIKGIT
jgi:hypothetical protein